MVSKSPKDWVSLVINGLVYILNDRLLNGMILQVRLRLQKGLPLQDHPQLVGG